MNIKLNQPTALSEIRQAEKITTLEKDKSSEQSQSPLLTQAAKARLASMSDVDQSKVDFYKAQLKQGLITPDLNQLADNLVSSAQELSGK
ncbi:flagellar biosynthesis anti-sigma factor FlgM [Vibrio marisflavi]|uniref:Anti-sigma-28 factor FlgM C-terminal domain-containing protein n=1 Tax=Vibrio marisflavi CECT 7928 TaxID=634439 RepID=A0ABM9A591_9VIBR|nr:flagellar biosynthesis anti-sigma factor FlgM [Vibrio marisflavi]CAH0540071.1 hypothetical protein VMF7928_02601 [Vibrio marisflavi CECT 7928]